jgi:hypothetical protein
MVECMVIGLDKYRRLLGTCSVLKRRVTIFEDAW